MDDDVQTLTAAIMLLAATLFALAARFFRGPRPPSSPNPDDSAGGK
jgi:hypothetical protein